MKNFKLAPFVGGLVASVYMFVLTGVVDAQGTTGSGVSKKEILGVVLVVLMIVGAIFYFLNKKKV